MFFLLFFGMFNVPKDHYVKKL